MELFSLTTIPLQALLKDKVINMKTIIIECFSMTHNYLHKHAEISVAARAQIEKTPAN